MRLGSALVLALTLLFVGPALAHHHDEASDGITANAEAAKGDHADDHGDAGHGDSHAKAKAPSTPASTGQVGFTATAVLILVGSGIGLIGVLREQLG